MSSGRGPGVIGMIMALVVLIGFGLLFMLAFDEGFQGGEQTIESVIARQAAEIQGYQNRIADGGNTLAKAPARITVSKELSGLKRQNQATIDQMAALRSAIETGNQELASRIDSFADYKDQYRAHVRGQAKGESLPRLETRAGVVYKNVSIREVTPVGIQIRHEDGQKRIPFEELPEAMIDYYQFDPDQKAAALVAERATRQEHEAAADVANTAFDQATAMQREKEREERSEKLRVAIAEKQALVSSLNAEITGLEGDIERANAEAAAARMAGRMHLNKSGNITANIRSKRGRIAILQAEISQLNFSLQN